MKTSCPWAQFPPKAGTKFQLEVSPALAMLVVPLRLDIATHGKKKQNRNQRTSLVFCCTEAQGEQYEHTGGESWALNLVRRTEEFLYVYKCRTFILRTYILKPKIGFQIMQRTKNATGLVSRVQ